MPETETLYQTYTLGNYVIHCVHISRTVNSIIRFSRYRLIWLMLNVINSCLKKKYVNKIIQDKTSEAQFRNIQSHNKFIICTLLVK